MKEKYFDIAKNIADLSDFKRVQVGCVIVYKNKVLNAACNLSKTRPLQKLYNKERFAADSVHSLHAEIHALLPLLDSDINWKKVDIYIYRKRKDKPFGMARPCKSCLALIKDLGIKNVYYTTNYGFAHEYIK